MLDSRTKKLIDSARDVLVGKVPDPKAQVEQITIALIYKFMDDMDKESQELGGEPKFFSGDFSQYSWSKLFDNKLSGQARLDLYVQAITNMSRNPNIPDLFRDIFKGAFLPHNDPRILSLFLKEINEFTYDHSENLGNAYEYLLSILGSQGDAGQFRTPRHIIDFIVEVVDPQKNETILDPACGTAGFLISAYKHILNQNKEKPLTPEEKLKLMNNLAGYDISPDMVRLALVNMYLHGFPDPKIHEYDTLSDESRWDEIYDVILANPPFMTPKGGISPHKRFSIQASRAEVLFVDYIAEHLSIKGRAGIIVPEGIIFQSSNAYKNLRKNLIENWGLYAVVSLPSGVFQPYSGVKTSILFIDRELAKKRSEILFVKVEQDGFDLGANRRPISQNDLPTALEILNKWKTDEKVESKLALYVEKAKIAESGDYNLTGDRYRVATDYTNAKWPMVELGEVCDIQSGSRQKGGAVDKGIYSIGGEQISEDNSIRFEKMKFITANHFAEMKKGVLQRDDVLVVKDGATTGKVGFWPYDYKAAVNEHVFIFRANEKILPKYLFNVVKSDSFQYELRSYIKGIIGGINLEIKSIKIPLPPLEIQEQIVAELDGYANIIAGAKQIAQNWKPKIDIDPEWPMVKLGEVCEIKSGGTPRKGEVSYYENGLIPWLKSEICKDEVVTEPKTYITEEGLKNSSAKWLPENTTLIALVGATIGKTAFIKFKATTNQNVAGLYPRDLKQLDPFYLYLVSQTLYDEFMRLGDSGFKMANLSFIKNLEIPLPPLKIQKQIVEKIEAERALVESAKKLIDIYEQKTKEAIAKLWD